MPAQTVALQQHQVNIKEGCNASFGCIVNGTWRAAGNLRPLSASSGGAV